MFFAILFSFGIPSPSAKRPCHSEERSDEESLIVALFRKEGFFASLRMTPYVKKPQGPLTDSVSAPWATGATLMHGRRARESLASLRPRRAAGRARRRAASASAAACGRWARRRRWARATAPGFDGRRRGRKSCSLRASRNPGSLLTRYRARREISRLAASAAACDRVGRA